MSTAQILDPLALDFLWEAAGAGDLPYPLRLRSHGATIDERARLRARIHEDLRERGLVDRSGRVEPDVEHWLGIIARPDVAIDSLFLPEPATPVIAVYAAASGASGVLAVQRGDELTLSRVPGNALVTEVVGVLPPAPRGSETSISLPADEFAAVTPAAARAAAEGDPRRALGRLVATPNLRGGQLAVTVRDRMGGRRRSRVLSWFDKPSGRYLGTTSRGRDGRDWVTVAPVDAPTFRHRLAQLITEVNAR